MKTTKILEFSLIVSFLALLIVLIPLCGAIYGYSEPDTDRNGVSKITHDLGVDFCRNQCSQDSTCTAWTYVQPKTIEGSRPKCRIYRNSVPTAMLVPSENLHLDESCLSAVKGSNTNTVGCYKGPGNVTGTYDENYCEELCNGEEWCQAWTFVKPGANGTDPICSLKAYAPPPTKDPGRISGMKPSTQGDLGLGDWCYEVTNTVPNKITFYVVVRNFGVSAWASAIEGSCLINVNYGSSNSKSTAPVSVTLGAFPSWKLEAGTAAKLTGPTIDLFDDFEYSILGLASLNHPEDVYINNNILIVNPPAGLKVQGTAFGPNGSLYGNRCK
jgi:hypothetical protein